MGVGVKIPFKLSGIRFLKVLYTFKFYWLCCICFCLYTYLPCEEREEEIDIKGMKKLTQHGNFKHAVAHLTTLHRTEPVSHQIPPTGCCSLRDTLCVQWGIKINQNPPSKCTTWKFSLMLFFPKNPWAHMTWLKTLNPLIEQNIQRRKVFPSKKRY